MSDHIELRAYDPDWPAAFERERRLIAPVFLPPPLLIEHVGSTAVPRLRSKPVIDIIVLVEAGAVRRAIPALEKAGYLYRDESSGPHRSFLRKHDTQTGERTHHLHIHDNADEVRRHVMFRDRLRSDERTRHEYEELKHKLATCHRDDRRAYAGGKTAFVDGVIRSLAGPARQTDWNF